jgi:hypothetical protein
LDFNLPLSNAGLISCISICHSAMLGWLFGFQFATQQCWVDFLDFNLPLSNAGLISWISICHSAMLG